jgi:hypothetical protein
MTTTNLANGVTFKKQIDSITTAEADIAATGTKVAMVVIDAAGNTILTKPQLVACLGQTEYDNECNNAKTALNSALGSALTTANSALAAL